MGTAACMLPFRAPSEHHDVLQGLGEKKLSQ